MNLHFLRLLSLLAQVTPDSAGAWVKLFVTNLGVPGALLAGILFAGHKGWIRWGREVEREREFFQDQKKQWEDWTKILTKEKDNWHDIVMSQQHLAERTVKTGESSVDQMAAMKEQLAAATEQVAAMKRQLATATRKAATP